MSYVELRNQNRTEIITAIRSYLLPGDLTIIQKRSGKSKRAVQDTLNIGHPLYSKDVISAAWDYLVEAGRLSAEDIIANL